MKIITSFVLALLTLLAVFIIYIHSGWYNVSAMIEESGLTKWIFKTTKNNSIKMRIKNISVPDLKDSTLIIEGFEHYKEMCESCHGAPGVEETELSKGLNPPAPYLVKEAKELDPKELFWITKNGIRMTGMPAWGKTHSDEQIWTIVAFMKKLPDLTTLEYQEMSKNLIENEKENIKPKGNHTHHH